MKVSKILTVFFVIPECSYRGSIHKSKIVNPKYQINLIGFPLRACGNDKVGACGTDKVET